jgi:two-component system sensor kinase FixL
MCRAQASRDAQGRPIEWFGTNTDGEERRQVEEALHKAQVDLAHLTRVTTMGELAASIAHEMNQPLGAIVNNGNVCLRLLSQSSSRNDEAIEALSDMVNDANRASAIIGRIRGVLLPVNITVRTFVSCIFRAKTSAIARTLPLHSRSVLPSGAMSRS